MVIDPIQSVKGKVVIDAFRLINPQVYIHDTSPCACRVMMSCVTTIPYACDELPVMAVTSPTLA